MKKMWTTCYGRIRQLPKEWVLIQTSNKPPEWFKGNMRFVFEFAPEAIVKKWQGKVVLDWKADYLAQLRRLFKSGKLREIIDSLPANAVLLCFEADHNDCHRKVLADFLVQNRLADVQEWKAPEPETKPDNQLALI